MFVVEFLVVLCLSRHLGPLELKCLYFAITFYYTVRFFRLDSDLEAFSHYPASVALQHWLASQPRYQRLEATVPLVLSCFTVNVPIISRVKLTCLTTV